MFLEICLTRLLVTPALEIVPRWPATALSPPTQTGSAAEKAPKRARREDPRCSPRAAALLAGQRGTVSGAGGLGSLIRQDLGEFSVCCEVRSEL